MIVVSRPASRARGPRVRRRAPTHRAARPARVRPVAAGAAAATVLLGSGVAYGLARDGSHPAPTATRDAASRTSTFGSQVAALGATAVSCWDGTTAAHATGCPEPRGLAGLATVFPSLSSTCSTAAPAVAGQEEVFVCRGAGYVVRYARWQAGYDRFAVLDHVNGAAGKRWDLADTFAGRVWSSVGRDADGRNFRWTATYRRAPFSVQVVASTAHGRYDAVAGVAAVPAGRIGAR